MSISALHIQSVLLPLILQGRSFQHVLNMIEQLLGTPLSFRPAGDMFACIASNGHPVQCQTEYTQFSRGGALNVQKLIEEIKNAVADEYGVKLVISDNFTYPKYLISDVTIGERYLGFVTIPEMAEPLEKIDRASVAQACSMLALAGVSDDSLSSALKSGILTDLIGGFIHTKPQLALRLLDMRPYEGRTWRLIVMKDAKTGLSELLLQLTVLFPKAETVLFQSYICTLMDISKGDLPEKDTCALAALARQFNTVACMGEPFGDLMDCCREFKTLSGLPQLVGGSGGPLLYYRDLKLFGLFAASGLGPAELTRFCDQRINAMRAYDNETGGCLYETLCCYMHCGRSVTDAAAKLFVHTNTIFYRLARMKKRFHLDVNNARDVVNIQLTQSLLEYIAAFEPTSGA